MDGDAEKSATETSRAFLRFPDSEAASAAALSVPCSFQTGISLNQSDADDLESVQDSAFWQEISSQLSSIEAQNALLLQMYSLLIHRQKSERRPVQSSAQPAVESGVDYRLRVRAA